MYDVSKHRKKEEEKRKKEEEYWASMNGPVITRKLKEAVDIKRAKKEWSK